MLSTIAALGLSLAVVGGAAQSEPEALLREESAAFARARAGDHVGSTERLLGLLAAAPASPRACLWRERIFLSAIASDDDAEMWAAAQALTERWLAIRGSADPRAALVRVCRDDVSGALRYLAARWHNEVVGRCEIDRVVLAVEAYRRYLEVFPDDPDAYELEFLLAQVLHAGIHLSMAPRGQGCVFTCGTNTRLREEARRARGEPPPSCDPEVAREGELTSCPWSRAARDAYRRVLERDPEGRYSEEAAAAQLMLTAQMVAFEERERLYDSQRVEGEYIVRSRWQAPCADPNAECDAPRPDPERWPSVRLRGTGWGWPTWRMP